MKQYFMEVNPSPPNEIEVFGKLTDYGVLGIVVFALGFIVYKMWKKDIDEKNHLIKRLEDLNDEIRKESKK